MGQPAQLDAQPFAEATTQYPQLPQGPQGWGAAHDPQQFNPWIPTPGDYAHVPQMGQPAAQTQNPGGGWGVQSFAQSLEQHLANTGPAPLLPGFVPLGPPPAEMGAPQGPATATHPTAATHPARRVEAAPNAAPGGLPFSDAEEKPKLLQLSQPGNEVRYTMAEVVESARSVLLAAKLPQTEVYTAMKKGGAAGPYVISCSQRALECILAHSETITLFKPSEDEEGEFSMEPLDSEGRTEANRERYRQTREAAGGQGREARRETEAIRMFIDFTIRFMGLGEIERQFEIDRVQAMFAAKLEEVMSGAEVGGEATVNFDVAMSDSNIALNGCVAFIQPSADANLEAADWTKLKYLDDDRSDGMITMRMPKKERERLGDVMSCCFRTEQACTDAKESDIGFCTRKDQAYRERRNRRAHGGGEEMRNARKREKEAAQESRKRAREEKAVAHAAGIAAAMKKPCPGWLAGTCARCADVVESVECGRCKRNHSGTDANGRPILYMHIPCQIQGGCPFPEGVCPYAGPHTRASAPQ